MLIRSSRFITVVAVTLCLSSFLGKIEDHRPQDYKGKPYRDSFYTKGPQQIPGKVECALYDLGGEGIAYHDKDSMNRGSGEYNYQQGHCEAGAEQICHFREKEGIDLSYTKEFLDFNHFNPYTPPRRQQFIGWTNDGESCSFTVQVKRAGTYRVGILYSNNACRFSLAVNNKMAGDFEGPSKTGSYHTWNKADSVGVVRFEKAGLHLLTLHYNGGSNYAYLEFSRVK